MKTRAWMMTALLVTSLTTACGSDDEEPVESGAATDAPAEMAEAAEGLDLTCEFAPKEDPDAVGLGTVRLLGENTSDVRIDSLTVTMQLSGSDGGAEVGTSVVYFMPGEQVAQQSPVLDEYEGQLDGGCTVSEVSGAHYGGSPLIEPEGGVCEVSGEPGDWDLRADFARVQGVPFDQARFVGVIAQVDGKRTAIYEDELEAGGSELMLRSMSEEEPTCSILYVRDL